MKTSLTLYVVTTNHPAHPRVKSRGYTNPVQPEVRFATTAYWQAKLAVWFWHYFAGHDASIIYDETALIEHGELLDDLHDDKVERPQ